MAVCVYSPPLTLSGEIAMSTERDLLVPGVELSTYNLTFYVEMNLKFTTGQEVPHDLVLFCG